MEATKASKKISEVHWNDVEGALKSQEKILEVYHNDAR